MPRRKLKNARLSVAITETQKSALQGMADRNDVSLARVIQEAIKEFVKRHKDRRLELFGRLPPPQH